MGYMGTGMQRWVYKIRPRRPFSKDRKPSAEEIPKYSRKFRPGRSIDTKQRSLDKYLWLAIILIGLAFVSIEIVQYYRYSKEQSQTQANRILSERKEAFGFLFNSGTGYYNRGLYEEAERDLELALRIKPQHKEARLYHALSLFMLCKTENNRCQDALRHIRKYQEEDPENMNLRKITADYFLLMGDTTKALDLLED